MQLRDVRFSVNNFKSIGDRNRGCIARPLDINLRVSLPHIAFREDARKVSGNTHLSKYVIFQDSNSCLPPVHVKAQEIL